MSLLETPYALLAAGTNNGQKATKLRDLLPELDELLANRSCDVIRSELR
jgi:hypothetical protein